MADSTDLLVAIGILVSPVIVALLVRLIWRFAYIGWNHEIEEYRVLIRRIIDAGRPVEMYRANLDDAARSLHLDHEKTRRIETDVLYPLGIGHFLLLPSLVTAPLMIPLGTLVIGVAIPVLMLVEYLLIRRGWLVRFLELAERHLRWQVIHTLRPHLGHAHRKEAIVQFHKVPRSVLLGLFAFLVVHWSMRDLSFGSGALDLLAEFMATAVVYIFLLTFIGVVVTAFEADLSFVDPAAGQLVPIETWVENMVNPLIGLGLILLTVRNLTFEADFGDPIAFSLMFNIVLYTASVVGIAFQIGYGQFRGSSVRTKFTQQVIHRLDPHSYDLTRTKGRIDFSVRSMMSDRVGTRDAYASSMISFDELDTLPSIFRRGVGFEAPQNPLAEREDGEE